MQVDVYHLNTRAIGPVLDADPFLATIRPAEGWAIFGHGLGRSPVADVAMRALWQQVRGESASPHSPFLKAAGFTAADDESPLAEAFRRTNHVDADWTADRTVGATGLSRRSTSVGDVIVVSDGRRSEVWAVSGMGYDALHLRRDVVRVEKDTFVVEGGLRADRSPDHVLRVGPGVQPVRAAVLARTVFGLSLPDAKAFGTPGTTVWMDRDAASLLSRTLEGNLARERFEVMTGQRMGTMSEGLVVFGTGGGIVDHGRLFAGTPARGARGPEAGPVRHGGRGGHDVQGSARSGPRGAAGSRPGRPHRGARRLRRGDEGHGRLDGTREGVGEPRRRPSGLGSSRRTLTPHVVRPVRPP